jgi:hypothetical protein
VAGLGLASTEPPEEVPRLETRDTGTLLSLAKLEIHTINDKQGISKVFSVPVIPHRRSQERHRQMPQTKRAYRWMPPDWSLSDTLKRRVGAGIGPDRASISG